MNKSNNQLHSEGYSNSKVGKMMGCIIRLAMTVAVMTLLIFASQPTTAADYPAKGKVITQIVPFGVGGSIDLTARYMQPLLEKELGVPMPIINKVGGAGAVGFLEFLNTKPDGYTICWVTSPSWTATYMDLQRKPTYGRKDFVLVANVALDPTTVLVRPDSPYKTLKDLVNAAKANPGKIKTTTSNLMSTSHVAGTQLELAAGVKFAYILYDQQGEQRAALLGGHADAEFNTASESAPAVKSGQLRSLAVFDNQPSRFLAGVPTAISQGYKASFSSVRGIAVKAGTPDSIVNALDAAVRKALANPENQKDLEQKMLTTRYMGPKEYATFWNECEKQVLVALEDVKKAAASK